VSSFYEANTGMKVLPVSVVRQFKFTESESLLCLGLVQGKSLDDMADEFCQARHLLRDQFHNLLIKTGTDNEAKLVTILLSKSGSAKKNSTN
jgi:hypothetical protein